MLTLNVDAYVAYTLLQFFVLSLSFVLELIFHLVETVAAKLFSTA